MFDNVLVSFKLRTLYTFFNFFLDFPESLGYSITTMKIQNKYKARDIDNDSFSYKKKMASNGTFKISDWLKRRQEQGKPAGYGASQTKFLIGSKIK